MRDTFASELSRLARDDERIMFLTGDLGFGVFEGFQQEFPDQYLNVGVAEQNMVAVAAGLALEGRICFTYSIGNFPVLRCLEQIRNDAAYHDANVKVVSVGGGFSYGPLGMSHHATEDIAVMRAMPAVASFTPGTLADVKASVSTIVDTPGTCYLRLDKSSGWEVDGAEPFASGRWRIMRQGDDVTLVAVGGVLADAQQAAEMLAADGVAARVVDATQMAPMEVDDVVRALGTASLIVTLEEHVVRGGLGGVVAEAMAEVGTNARLVRKGIGREFVSQVGSQMYLRTQAGLDAESVARIVLSQLG